MSSAPVIEAHGICKTYSGQVVLSALSLQLQAGEVLGLLGVNGAGKSTTLGILSGVISPTSGVLKMMGQNPYQRPKVVQRLLGYLPEQLPLYPELTVDEYLWYCARLRGVPSNRCSVAVKDAKHLCGLSSEGRRLSRNLSKGFQQRLGIAQAIVHQPKLIILDEPSSGLDPEQAHSMRELISSLGEHRSVILSTHLLADVQAACSRVAILAKGRLVYDEPIGNQGTHRGMSQLIVQLKKTVTSSDLMRAIPELKSVHMHTDGWLLKFRSSEISVDKIARCAYENQWGLGAIYPPAQTLEKTFLSVISQDNPAVHQESESA